MSTKGGFLANGRAMKKDNRMKDKKFTYEKFAGEETFRIDNVLVSELTYNIELSKQRKRQMKEKKEKR